MLDLRTPRPGKVDPETCPMCALLRDSVSAAISSGSQQTAVSVVRAMHTHMFYGHPNDPRNTTR